MSKSLIQQVHDALEARRGDWPTVSQRAGVSYSWLSKFVRGKIPNPGLRTLERVRDAMVPSRQRAKA